MSKFQRPANPCEVGCHRGWLECGGIDDDSRFPWVQMCDNCTSVDGESDDDLAASWAAQDTGLEIGLAHAKPNGGKAEDFPRPYLKGGTWSTDYNVRVIVPALRKRG